MTPSLIMSTHILSVTFTEHFGWTPFSWKTLMSHIWYAAWDVSFLMLPIKIERVFFAVASLLMM